MLLGLAVLGVGLCFFKRNRTKDSVFLLISFVALSVMSAIRYDVGYDYSYIYAPAYHRMLIDTTGEYWARHSWEPGFRFMLRGLMELSLNYQAIFVVTSVLFVGLVMLFFWLYSPNPAVSVFLFITLSHFYCSMNFIRQALAAAIAMFAFPLIKKIIDMFDRGDRDIKAYILFSVGYFAIVLFAASFHMSALLLIPFFFINLIPVNKFVLPAYAAITAVIYFNTTTILEFVTRFWYQNYPLESRHMQVGFSPQFAIAAAAVFIVLFVGAGLLKKPARGNYLYVNYAFFAFFFILIGTRHSVVDRLSLNFVLLLPVGAAIVVNELIKTLKDDETLIILKKRVAVLAVLLFTIVGGGLSIHHYALTMDHHGVVPYQIIFNQPFYREYTAHLRTVRMGLQEPVRRPLGPQTIELQRPQGVPRVGEGFSPERGEAGPFRISLDEFIAFTTPTP